MSSSTDRDTASGAGAAAAQVAGIESRYTGPFSRSPRWLARLSRTLTTRFMLRVGPIIVVCFVLVIGAYQWLMYVNALRELPSKLSVISASVSLILGDAVADRNAEKIGLIIASVVSDPDVAGIAVYDVANSPLDVYGTGYDTEGELVQRTSINHVTDTGYRQVGWLTVALTDANIVQEISRSLTYQLSVALMLLGIAVVGSVVAFRSTIGVPLARLMRAIRQAEASGQSSQVDWRTDDELGELIAAYNAMQRKRQAVEADLLEAKELAEVASRAKSEFLANMSHELRTPLNSIIGFSDVIRNEMLGPNGNPRYRGYAEGIHQSGHHLLAIIQDILDISRIEAGHTTLEEEAVDLKELYRSCMTLIGHRAEARHIRLIDSIPRSLPPLLADQRHLKQILVNLLSNAVKFTGPAGTITTSAHVDEEGAITLTVVDSGIGIADEDQEKIFEPFTQVASSQARAHEGSGLGLSICRALTVLHGGSIDLESALDVGTTVTLRFPASRTLARPPAVEGADNAKTGTDGTG